METCQPFQRGRACRLLDHFAEITDAWQGWKVMYPLREVLFLVVCGTIASGDDTNIVDWATRTSPSCPVWSSPAASNASSPVIVSGSSPSMSFCAHAFGASARRQANFSKVTDVGSRILRLRR